MYMEVGPVNIDNNWWGRNTGPAAGELVNLSAANWIVMKHTPTSTALCAGTGSTTLTASFLQNSAGTSLSASNLTALVGQPITFSSPVNGSLSGAQATIQSTGTATVTFNATTAGIGRANADFAPAVENFSLTSTPDITITNCCPTITVTNPATNTGTVGVPFSQNFSASGGASPYTYTLNSGALPPGLTLNANTGTLSGNPTTQGTYNFTVRATDNNLCFGNGATYSLTISPAQPNLSINNVSSNEGNAGTTTFRFTVSLSSPAGAGGVTFDIATANGTTNPANCSQRLYS